jgi:anti-anti-sigma regulatory factor
VTPTQTSDNKQDSFMSFTIRISNNRQTVLMSVKGRFDLSQGFALWQYCQPDQRSFQTFIFDLKEVHDLRDSGVGWLMMFKKHAQKMGAGLEIINAGMEHVGVLSEVGLITETSH